MKRSKLAIIAIVSMLAALVLTVSGCTVGSSSEYKAEDSTNPIRVEKGNSFTIVLDSNPTTGYQWQFASAIDENVISLTKTEYVKAEPAAIGSGGQEKWTFLAENVGETSIQLNYVRPWETPADGSTPEEQAAQQETRSLSFKVIVVKKGSTTATPKQYTDEGQTIEAEQNIEFEIVLEANHTTGYQWQLSQPLDDSILEVTSTTYAQNAGGGVGVGGKETWTIDPVGLGSTSISLEYLRPWETGVPPAQEKTFHVEVTEPAE